MKKIGIFVLFFIVSFTMFGCSSQVSNQKTEEELKAEIREEMESEAREKEKLQEEKKLQVEGNKEDNKKNLPSIESGDRHSILLKADNTLWTWGSNDSGQLGTGERTIYSEENVISENHDCYTPVKVMENVISASAGDAFTLAVDSNHVLYGFGYAEYGELSGLTDYILTPTKIEEDILYVDCDLGTTAIIKSDHSLWLSGIDYNATADGCDWVTTNSFYKVLDNVKDVSVQTGSVMALTMDNEVYMMGDPQYMSEVYQSGDNTYIGEMVQIIDGVVSINNKYQTPQIINVDGKLYTWGYNGNDNKLGTGSDEFYVSNLQSIMDNVLESEAQMLLTKENELYVWGMLYSGYDFLGDSGYFGGCMGDIITEFSSTPDKLLEGIQSISAGEASFAIDDKGNVWAYGNNAYGMLGNGTSTVWDYDMIDDGEYEMASYFISQDNEGREPKISFNLNDLK